MRLKQRLFAQEYLVDLNATRAAIAAGYSKKTAYSQGQRLLKNVEVRAAIEKRLGKIFDRLDLSAEHILRELACIAFARMDEFIEVKGHDAYIAMEKVDSDKAAAITELTSDVLISGTQTNGDGEEVPVEIKRTKIKLGGKIEALRLLAQYRTLLTHKVEHSGDNDRPVRVLWIGEKKQVAQQRVRTPVARNADGP